MARPTKLTPELQAAFVEALKRTYYFETAADLVGVDRFTIRRWIKRGKKEKSGLYFSFCAAVKKVLAEKMGESVSIIEIAGREAWTARAWLLERRWPDQWGSATQEIAKLRKEVAEIRKEMGRASNSPAP